MPRELQRKRGKKKKATATVVEEEPVQVEEPEYAEAGPSRNEIDAPFGYVDPDVKAYFRTVDDQLREWQDLSGDLEQDPNEDRRLFVVAALREVHGKERQLCTDPDCAGVIERMAYSMDNFSRRVFLDSLAGSYEQLARHRFASHVCQTFLQLLPSTIDKETTGQAEAINSEQGTLRTAIQLVLDFCDEILPSVSSMTIDPFASHVVRSLIAVLVPGLASSPVLQRSKKSKKWKESQQGTLSSVLEVEEPAQAGQASSVPKTFRKVSRQILDAIRSYTTASEIRALALDKSGSPTLTLFLELEAKKGISEEPDSLMDRVLDGLITAVHEETEPVASDFVGGLLRDSTGSRVLESVIALSSQSLLSALWRLYFVRSSKKLSIHPIANYLVAKAIGKLDEAELAECLGDLEDTWDKVVAAGRLGILTSVVDRTVALNDLQDRALMAVKTAFGLDDLSPNNSLAQCVLYMRPLQELGGNADSTESDVTVQGSLLLQALLRLQDPDSRVAVDSINALASDQIIKIACSPAGSRVFDALLDSETVSRAGKRRFLLSLIDHYHTLASDRFGSRVAEHCWNCADGFLKEKIARSLVPHERSLGASYFGKYLARKIQTPLLLRQPEAWRERVAAPTPSINGSQHASFIQKRPASGVAKAETGASSTGQKKRKRGDAIDEVFSATLSNKYKRNNISNGEDASKTQENIKESKGAWKPTRTGDDNLDIVLGAIRTAPKGDAKNVRKDRKKA